MRKESLFTLAYVSFFTLVQVIMGNFPVAFFAFPLNAIVAVIWLFLLWNLYKERSSLLFTRFLFSPRTSILSIILLIMGSLVIGLFPQLSDAEATAQTGIWGWMGCYNFMSSWIFVAILFLLLSNLAMITLHAYYHRKTARKRFILNHTGLWIALFAGVFGSSDVQTMRVPLYAGQPTQEAYHLDGSTSYLTYELELHSFHIDRYPNGQPSRFAADVRIGNNRKTIEVNHPYSPRFGEDIYLTGYDTQREANTGYCILQIVRQPWKYVVVVGILMMLAGAVLLFINGPKKKNNDNLE